MPSILFASFNKGKIKEYKLIFKKLAPEIKLVSLFDLKIKEKIEEKGSTYKEIAANKAKFYAKIANMPTLGDDGGIEIDYLNGKPGIFSRRWLGYEAKDEELIEKIIKELKGVKKSRRKAWLKVGVALFLPKERKIFTSEGKIRGIILDKAIKKRIKGYPFRTVFYIPSRKKTFINFTQNEIIKYSHRAKAIKKLLRLIGKQRNKI